MSINRIKQILGSKESKNSLNKDTFIKLELNQDSLTLQKNDINHSVNLNEQFNSERNSSNKYRLIGNISPLFSNPLFNMSDDLKDGTLNYFDNGDFNSDSFEESVSDNLKEINGWFGYFDPSRQLNQICSFVDMEPSRNKFSFTIDSTNSNAKNWDLMITYPSNIDDTHYLINGGLLIINRSPIVVSNKNMISFGCPINHNLKVGDLILLKNVTNQTSIDYNSIHEVKSVGLEDGSFKENYFSIDIPLLSITINSNTRFTKIIDGFESKYYFRLFEKVKTIDSNILSENSFDVYKAGFTKTIYGDDVFQFVINDDIDTSNLVDNLGRPISELYLTLVKTDSQNKFTPLSSGIETNFIQTLNDGQINPSIRQIPIINKIHGNVNNLPFISYDALETNITINNTSFYGDIVEYNVKTLKEVILSDVQHRFNSKIREASVGTGFAIGPRNEGYYYKAHHLIKIREFSDYIEEGDNLTINIPDYFVDLGNGKYIWRDLLDIGDKNVLSNKLDYPFINGCHYIFNDFHIFLKRQDPFNIWGLYFSGPTIPDPIGARINNNFIVNNSENVC